jgi:hypothetical protein
MVNGIHVHRRLLVRGRLYKLKINTEINYVEARSPLLLLLFNEWLLAAGILFVAKSVVGTADKAACFSAVDRHSFVFM